MHEGHTVVHCRCVHCGNDNTREKPGDEVDKLACRNPSLILFDVLALHAAHWAIYRGSEEEGNEMRSGAGLRARASAPVRQRAWCMPMARPELPHTDHVNARHVRPRATSTRYVVEVCGPLIRRKCRAVETNGALSSFR